MTSSGVFIGCNDCGRVLDSSSKFLRPKNKDKSNMVPVCEKCFVLHKLHRAKKESAELGKGTFFIPNTVVDGINSAIVYLETHKEV